MEELDQQEKEKFMFQKPDFKAVSGNITGSISSGIKKPIVKTILKNAYLGLLCYLVIFVLGEILISGGKSERNPYFTVVMIIFLIVAQLLIIKRKNYASLKDTITSAVTVTVTIALLDYLIVNLAFEKNNYVLYKYWPTYLIYLTALVLPFIRSNFEDIKYRWKELKTPNLKLHLTKKNPTL